VPLVDIPSILLVWVGIGAAGALASLAVGFARLRRARPPAAEPRPEVAPPLPGEPAAAPVAEVEAPLEPVRAAPDLRVGLRKTRLALLGQLEGLLRGRDALAPELLEEIESVLFSADIGVQTADDLLEAARSAERPDRIKAALEARAIEILASVPPRAPAPEHEGPRVVLIVGVNGSGKTTTIGKLAARWVRGGKRVLVAAADTFRAAAIDQLQIWAERAGAEIVRGVPGGDPAAVAFDAVRAANAKGFDIVLVDTAGRLQTHRGLMDELSKIARAVQKQLPGAPHEVLLVLDANTGQNAIRQAEEFTRATDVTGIVLAKLDGTAKGGVVLGISQELGVPVRYVGVGEGIDDLVDFDAEAFVRALFEREGEGNGEALRPGA
jgi:fused signal recognition particle receptor